MSDQLKKSQRRWSADQVLNEIRHLKDLSAKSIQRRQPSLYGAAVRYFGSWMAAIEKAGFDYSSVLKRKRPGYWSRAKIIEEIRGLEHRNSGNVRRSHAALYNAALRVFGSWKEAVDEAGFDYRKEAKGWIASADHIGYSSWKPRRPK